MLKKLAKRSDENLIRLVKLSKTGLRAALVIERKSGMPKYYKVPKPSIPAIKLKKGILNGRRIR